MIDKLIEKYKNNYNYLNQFVITDRTEFDSEEDYVSKSIKLILSKLKESDI